MVYWDMCSCLHRFPYMAHNPAISHMASGLVWYGWLLTDTSPYPFFTKRVTNLLSAHPRHPPLPTYLYYWQWANLTMGPNGQNEQFAELRQKVSSSIHNLVLQRGLPSLDVKFERFVTKKMKKRLPTLESYRLYSNGDFRWTWRRAYGHDFSYECKTYEPKSIWIIFCHLYFHMYTMLADYNAHIMFWTLGECKKVTSIFRLALDILKTLHFSLLF